MSAPDRVVLTPLAPGDSPTLFTWINDRELVQFNAPFRPVSRPEHDAWFDVTLNRTDVTIFAIRLASTGELIGTCQLNNIDRTERSAQLQIRIGERAAQGRGYGTAAVAQLLAFGFRDLGLKRITLHVFAHNSRAIRVYEKCGFRREGLIPRGISIDGKDVDILLMAASRPEDDR